MAPMALFALADSKKPKNAPR